MSPSEYQRERKLRGTQASAAEALGVARETIARRESGDPKNPISREAWLALLSIPKTTAKPEHRR